MTFSELPEPNKESIRAYTRELIELARHEHIESRNRIVGYLFAINTGGLVAGITYVAAKPTFSGGGIVTAIVLFAIGLGASMLRATLDYFGCEKHMNRLMNHVKLFYSNGIAMETFLSERDKPSTKQWPFYTLAWISAACFFVGLTIGLWAVSK